MISNGSLFLASFLEFDLIYQCCPYAYLGASHGCISLQWFNRLFGWHTQGPVWPICLGAPSYIPLVRVLE